MSGRRSANRSRFPSRWVTSVGVIGAVAASTLAMESMGTASAATLSTVTLTLDGVGLQVTTSADTVGELLDDESIVLDGNDEVSPHVSTEIGDGLTVDVDHIWLVTVLDDDDSSQHLVSADTVSEVNDELSLPAPTFSALTAEPQPVNYRRTLHYGPAGKRLFGDDLVRDGAKAVIQDVRIGYPKARKRVDNKLSKRRTKLLHSGTSQLMRRGHDGVQRLTYRRVFVEGELSGQRVVKRTWLRKPKNRLVRIGTGPNWPALAQCESGGNPRAVNPAGYYGLYQFSLATWRAMGGSGYPTDHGYWEQTRMAWKLYRQSGRSPWPVCGALL